MPRRNLYVLVGVLVAAALVVVLILTLGGNGGSPVVQGSGGPSTSGSGAPTSGSGGTSIANEPPPISQGPVQAGVKPIITGLIDRQGAPPNNMLSYVHAYVVKVNWADIQPTENGPIVSDNAIDKAIARVREPDYAAVGMKLKLRVFAGINSPSWVKSLGGSPISYKNNQAGGSVSGGTLGRFWSTASEQAYAQLEQKLAAKYDDVPEIREVTMSGCTTLFDEPFVRQPGEADNAANLKAAGYTDAADKACLVNAMKAHEVWQHTTTDVDFSPFPDLEGGTDARDVNYTIGMMNTCRQLLQYRCGLQNNALSTDKLSNTDFVTMYQRMALLGSPVIFQTAARKRIGDESQVMIAAVNFHANSVELPQGYPKWSTSVLQTAATDLAKNPVK